MKKVFISGISSEIMSKLICLIDKENYEIIGISRKKDFSIESGKIIYGDINNIESFSNYLSDCSLIIHAAALTHSYNKNEYFETNFEATKKIVDIIKNKNNEKFVYISSNTAGASNGAYGYSKYLAEEYIRKHLNNWLIIRPSEVFGINKNKEGIEKLISDLIHKNYSFCPLGVPYNFHPIHISDLVAILFNTIFNESETKKVLTVNGNRPYSFTEIIKLTEKLKQKKIWIVPIPKPIMFIIKYFFRLNPFPIGVTPDQVDRLYGIKSINENNYENLTDIEEYIKKRILFDSF